jgi:hypothetical protein
VVLTLTDGSKETYVCDTPNIICGNLFFGETFVEPHQKCQIRNETTGDVADIEFKSRGTFSTKSADRHYCNAVIKNKEGDSKFTV